MFTSIKKADAFVWFFIRRGYQCQKSCIRYYGITRASMAALTLYNGTYGITIDKAVKNRVDFHLTPKNTIGSTQMTKPFTGTLKNLKCKFVDRTTGYAEDESLVSIDKAGNILYDQGEQEGDTQEATFRGITDSTQLRRVGRFELLKATRRVVTYSVQQDWEYLTAFPGAVGYLANDMLLYGIKSGRIRSVDHDTEGRVTQVGLDENVLFEEGKSYSLVVRHNNQEEGIQTYHVRRDETQGNYVTLSLPAKANLQPGNLYTFSERGKEAMQVLCTSITPSGDHSATLELVEYCPEIYTMDDKLPPWNSFITIPNEQSNPGWEKEVLPYIPPAKPGQPAKDVRLTTSEATVHSSSRGILQGKNITLECKLFNLVHAPKAEISSPAEPDESDKNGGSTETGESGETETLEPPAHTTIVWNHSDDLALTDTDNPLVKVLDLQVDKNLTDEENAQAQKNLEYIRKHTSFAIGVNFTDKDGTQYQDSVSIPVIYDGLNCEYLGAFNTLPEATVKGEPLLVGDWFLVEKTFSIKTDGEIVQGDITTNDGGKDNKGEGIVYRIADVYEYMGDGCWKESLDSSKIAQTLNDMLDLEPCEADVQAKDGKMLLQRLAANQAFIHKLVAQTITIPVDGAIESSGFSDEGTGFRLDGDGSFTAKDAELRGVFRGGQGLHKPARISAIETIGLSDISYKDPSQHIFVAAMDDEKGRNLSVRCYSTKEDNYTCGIILRVTEIQEVSYPYQNSQQKAHIKTLEYSFNKGETWQDLDSWYIWPPWLDDISAETWIDMHGSIGPFSLYVRNLQQFDAGTQWKFSYGNLKGISVQKSNGEEYFSAKDGVVTASKFVTPPGGKVDSAKDNHPIQVGSKNSDHLRIYDDGITRVNADGNLTTLYFQGGSKNDAPISGYTQFCGGVGVAGRVVITGDLEVRGNVTFKKNLTVSGKLTAEDTSNSLKGAKAN